MNKTDKAIKFATKVHRGQMRKGKDEPYVTHPLAVGVILGKIEASEDVVVAGILHDTIEDCKPYGSVTKATIAKEFGDKVAEMVDDVTEQDRTLTWEVRKKQALDHIPKMSHNSLLVKSADTLHNLTDLLKDVEERGDKAFEVFSTSKEKTIDRYLKVIEALHKAWNKNPLLPELDAAYVKLKISSVLL